jgi:hypothetical protein
VLELGPPPPKPWPIGSSTRSDRAWPPFCVPLFTSDGLNLYFSALTAHFGQWIALGCRGRKVLRWQVAAGLISGQVKKTYQRRKLVRLTPVMRLGTEDALKAVLQGLGLSGRLNTAFIERAPLTVRHGIAALARRTWATAKPPPPLLAHLEWWRAYSHGCRVPMPGFEWRSSNHVNEGANVWRSAIASVRQPWQPAEPIDDGQRGRCSLAPCRWLLLESGRSQVRLKWYVAGKLVKLPSQEVGRDLTRG